MINAIKNIVIVGKDVEAWITALFLKSGLDRLNNEVDITLIELPSSVTKSDFYSVLPSYKTLHKALGANEGKLAQTAQAHHFFGQKFSAWNNNTEDFIHAYDKLGVDFHGIDFYQYWLKAQQSGLQVSLEDFCFGAAAAKHSSFNINNKTGKHNIPAYGYHLSAIPYITSITRAAIASGVKHIKSEISNIDTEGNTETESNRVKAITLTDGTLISADIFIDASGSDALLINKLRKNNFTSWSHSFLCDRVITASIPVLNPTPSHSLISAFSSGWYGFYPLKDRTGVTIYYSSKHSNRADVLKELASLTSFELTGIEEKTIKCGSMKEPWIGNCIAIGNAAATLESLDALQLQPLVTSLVQLRELFPKDNNYQLEVKIYNRKVNAYIENLRNFQLAHYLLNTRLGDSFWDECRKVKPPVELEEKINLFKKFGHVTIREYETFQAENWTLLFNGHGLQAENYSALVGQISENELMTQFVGLLKKVGQDVKALS